MRVAAALLLFLWGWGVLWSRLALGAHYIADLIGGLLLGGTMLALASAIGTALAERRVTTVQRGDRGAF